MIIGSYSTSLTLGSFFSIPKASAKAAFLLKITQASVHLTNLSLFPSGRDSQTAHLAFCLI